MPVHQHRSMINPDSQWSIAIYQSETGALVEGATPDTRAVAMILCATRRTSRTIAPGRYHSLVSNAVMISRRRLFSMPTLAPAFRTPSSVRVLSSSQLIRSIGEEGTTNDRILIIRRDELADLVYERHDFEARMRSATQAIARCIAAYGLSNPGGPNDRRLPWPASHVACRLSNRRPVRRRKRQCIVGSPG